jgi:hypothetical protein
MMAIKIIFALALSVQASRVVESSAEFRAKLWLKAHQPSGDEAGMNDLKNSDPNAYAIVQALLTKKTLGLLDPNHPTAGFSGKTITKHKSFQEEAADEGLTQDTPSEAVSEMEMKSSMPFPSAGGDSAAPYPQVHASHDPWNYHTVHSDDDIVNSVVGDDTPAPAQAQDNSLSLSAVTAQEEHAMPPPAEHHHSAAPQIGGFNFNWDNPMAGSSEEVTAPAAPAAQQADRGDEDKSLSLSSVRSQEESNMGITESATRFAPPAAPVMQAQPAPVMQAQPAPVTYARNPLVDQAGAQMGIPSLDWNRPMPQGQQPEESLAAVASAQATVAQAAVVQAMQQAQAPIIANSRASNSASVDAPWTPPAQPKMAMNSYRMHMSSSYAMHASDATPSNDDILSLRKQSMGNSYDSFLKQARTNRWKRAMDVTMNMQPVHVAANNGYLSDLS